MVMLLTRDVDPSTLCGLNLDELVGHLEIDSFGLDEVTLNSSESSPKRLDQGPRLNSSNGSRRKEGSLD